MIPQRVLLTLSVLGMCTTQVSAEPTLVAEPSRTTVQLGQPIQIMLRVSQASQLPEIQVPKLKQASLKPGDQVQKRTVVHDPSANVWRGSQQPLPGERLAAALQNVGKHLPALLQDEAVRKALQDPAMQEASAEALKALKTSASTEYTFRYLLYPEKVGPLHVPAFYATWPGHVLKSEPFQVNVEETGAEEHVKLTWSVQPPKPLVGEEGELCLELLLPREETKVTARSFPYRPIRGAHLQMPLAEFDKVTQLEAVKPWDEFVRENAVPTGLTGIRLNEYTRDLQFERESSTDQKDPQWYRRKLKIPVKFLAGGQVDLPTAKLSGEVHPGKGAQPDSATGQLDFISFVAASSGGKFEIFDPKQRPDCPADYSGLAGVIKVQTALSQTQANVGDPLTLVVRIVGASSASRLSPPDLANQPDWSKHLRVRFEKEQTSAGQRDLHYTVRALTEGRHEVPAIKLTVFQPNSARFETVASTPLTLVAAGSASPSAGRTGGLSAPAGQVPNQFPLPDEAKPGSPFSQANPTHVPGIGRVADYQPGMNPMPLPFTKLFDQLQRAAYWLSGGLLAFLALLVAWKWWRRKRAQTQLAYAWAGGYAPHQAGPVAWQTPAAAPAPQPLAPPAVYLPPTVTDVPVVYPPSWVGTSAELELSGSQLRGKLSEFLRQKFALPKGEVTPVEAEQALLAAQVPYGLARQTVEMFEQCAACEFTGGALAGDLRSLDQQMTLLFRQLESYARAAKK